MRKLFLLFILGCAGLSTLGASGNGTLVDMWRGMKALHGTRATEPMNLLTLAYAKAAGMNTTLFYFGNACASNALGAWPTAGSWTSCGSTFPGAGDTATITHTITINGTAQSVGTGGATGTTALTITTPGVLTFSNGASLDMTGDLTLNSGTVNVTWGTLTIDSPVGTQYKVISQFGAGQLKQFNCGDGTWGHGIVTTAGAGTHGYVDLGISTATPASENLQRCQAINLGDAASGRGWEMSGCSHSNHCIDTIVNGFLVTGSGAVEFSYAGSDGSETFTIAGLEIRTPILTNGKVLTLKDESTNIGVRTLQTSGIYNNTLNLLQARIDPNGFTFGVSNGRTCITPGIRLYNISVAMSAGAKNVDFSCFMDVADMGLGTSGFSPSADAGNTFHNGLIFSYIDNQHPFQASSSLGIGANTYKDLWVDGGMFVVTDSSDVFSDTGTYTTKFNILTNKAGTLDDDLNGVSGSATILNNTLHNDFGVIMGEGTSSAIKYAAIKNNLFSKQTFGVSDANIVSAVRQSAPAGWLNNNGFFAMPGSGDSGAPITPPSLNLTNLTLGILSYVGFPIKQIVTGCTMTASATTTRAVSAACNASAAQVGDFVRITSAGHGGQNNYGRITAVAATNPLDVTVTTTATLQSGDTVEVDQGYFADSTVIYGGVGYGNLDVHADPIFNNPNADFCTWYVSTGGVAHCSAEGKLTLTAGTNSTTLNCSTCTFQTWGITTADTVSVVNCSISCADRGRSAVLSIPSQTQITVNSISGATSGDNAVFITATQGIAREMIKQNGWDYLGNSTSANTSITEAAALLYGRTAYTPTNTAYRRAGFDGSDIGAEQFSFGGASIVGPVKIVGPVTTR